MNVLKKLGVGYLFWEVSAVRAFLAREGISFWALVCMVALAVLLGVLNNLRVYEEQRVPWFGEVMLDDSAAAGDGEAVEVVEEDAKDGEKASAAAGEEK